MTLLLIMTLLLLFVKSLFVFALSGAALLCLRRASASARHLVCLLTLAALLALPLCSLTLPGWHVAAVSSTDQLPPQEVPPAPNNGGAGTGAGAGGASRSAPTGLSTSSPVPTLAPPLLGAGGHPFPWLPLLLTFYLLGVLLAAVRPLLGLWGIVHLRRACAPATDAPTLGVRADCAAALGLTRLPLLCRAEVPVPMTWGWHCPMVVLPLGFQTWPVDRLRSVLLHEMAHVKRRDWPCHRLADIACALYWFHPLVWLTARRLRAESEVACDDLVLASGIAAPDYARHLLEIASALPRVSRRSHSAIAMAQTSQIERRLLMILDQTRPRRAVARRVLLAALVPAAAVLVTLAVLRPDAKAQSVPSKAQSVPSIALKEQNVPAAGVTSTGVTISLPHQELVLKMSAITALKAGGPPMVSPDMTVNGTMLLAGITDAQGPGGKWWNADGKVLAQPVFNSAAAYSHLATTTSPGQRSLLFAFRLPPSAHNITANLMTTDGIGSSSEGTWPGKIQGQTDYTEATLNPDTGGIRVLSATYPATKAKGGLRVGLAFGAWKLAASEVLAPHKTTDVTGSFIFSPPAETAKGVLLAVSTNSTDDIRVNAVDAQGREILPAAIDGESINKLNRITAQFNLPLSQIKEFRVETRPFQWIEYKDVALKPVQ